VHRGELAGAQNVITDPIRVGIRGFDLNATQMDTLGTVTCEISGNNTLNRAP
jgi:hypothetical protein